jgi:zinc D-Ala-D-Ala carboxypeptidase
MQISKHITLEEACKSATADKLGIVNDNPSLNIIKNMKLLAEKVFEPVRAHFKAPIKVTSMYRGQELNNHVKGSITSQHCTGEAMDIDNVKPTNKEVFDYIKDNLEFDQLIWEFGTKDNPEWVHVSYESTGQQRKQILRAEKINGKTVYSKW